MFTAKDVSALRAATGAGMMDCKKALEATCGDMEKATVWLREKGIAAAAKKSDRIAAEGIVASYIHMGGKVSALVLLAQDNAEIAHDLAIHVSANKALYLTKADIPAEELARETAVQIEIVKNDPKLAGKPEAALAKIVEGKVNKNFVDSVLAEQPYLMEETLTVGKYLAQHNLSIVKFVRYAVGEGIERRQDNFVEEVMNQAK